MAPIITPATHITIREPDGTIHQIPYTEFLANCDAGLYDDDDDDDDAYEDYLKRAERSFMGLDEF